MTGTSLQSRAVNKQQQQQLGKDIFEKLFNSPLALASTHTWQWRIISSDSVVWHVVKSAISLCLCECETIADMHRKPSNVVFCRAMMMMMIKQREERNETEKKSRNDKNTHKRVEKTLNRDIILPRIWFSSSSVQVDLTIQAWRGVSSLWGNKKSFWDQNFKYDDKLRLLLIFDDAERGCSRSNYIMWKTQREEISSLKRCR